MKLPASFNERPKRASWANTLSKLGACVSWRPRVFISYTEHDPVGACDAVSRALTILGCDADHQRATQAPAIPLDQWLEQKIRRAIAVIHIVSHRHGEPLPERLSHECRDNPSGYWIPTSYAQFEAALAHRLDKQLLILLYDSDAPTLRPPTEINEPNEDSHASAQLGEREKQRDWIPALLAKQADYRKWLDDQKGSLALPIRQVRDLAEVELAVFRWSDALEKFRRLQKRAAALLLAFLPAIFLLVIWIAFRPQVLSPSERNAATVLRRQIEAFSSSRVTNEDRMSSELKRQIEAYRGTLQTKVIPELARGYLGLSAAQWEKKRLIFRSIADDERAALSDRLDALVLLGQVPEAEILALRGRAESAVFSAELGLLLSHPKEAISRAQAGQMEAPKNLSTQGWWSLERTRLTALHEINPNETLLQEIEKAKERLADVQPAIPRLELDLIEAMTYHRRDDFEKCEQITLAARSRGQELVRQGYLSPDDFRLFRIRNLMGLVYWGMSRYSEAETAFRELLAPFGNNPPQGDLRVLVAQHNLAGVLLGSERYADAEIFFKKTLDGFASLFATGPSRSSRDPLTGLLLPQDPSPQRWQNLAAIYAEMLGQLGRRGEALRIYEQIPQDEGILGVQSLRDLKRNRAETVLGFRSDKSTLPPLHLDDRNLATLEREHLEIIKDLEKEAAKELGTAGKLSLSIQRRLGMSHYALARVLYAQEKHGPAKTMAQTAARELRDSQPPENRERKRAELLLNELSAAAQAHPN